MPLITLQSAKGYGWGNRTSTGGANSYDSISTVALTSSNNTITFNSIPQTYKHLEIRWYSWGGSYGVISTQQGAGSREWYMASTGGSTMGSSSNSASLFPDDAAPSGYGPPTMAVAQILDYTSSKLKVLRDLEGFDNNGGSPSGTSLFQTVFLDAGTAAITSLSIGAVGGSSTFTAGTHVALYGIKG